MNILNLFPLILYVLNVLGDDTWEVTSKSDFPKNFFQLVIMEGLCTDGSNFIVGTKDQIFLMTSDFEVISSLTDAIPHSLREEGGYNHLGDCQFSNGLIYFPVEEPSYTKPAIFIYELHGSSIKYIASNAQSSQEHMPWIAMDSSSQLLYSSNYDNVTTLQVYNTALNFIKDVTLSTTLSKVQGGAFYEGLLYVGVNGGDTVFSIDVETGVVDVAMQQTEPGSDDEYEFEGLTFLDLTEKGLGIMHNTGNHCKPTTLLLSA